MREENLGRIALTHSSTMWHGHKLKIYGRKRHGDIRYNYHTEECYILESWRSFYCLKKTENHQGDNDLCLHFGSTSTIRDLPLSELQIWTMHTPNSMRIHGVLSRMFNVLVTGKTRKAKMMSGLPKSQLCIGGGRGGLTGFQHGWLTGRFRDARRQEFQFHTGEHTSPWCLLPNSRSHRGP